MEGTGKRPLTQPFQRPDHLLSGFYAMPCPLNSPYAFRLRVGGFIGAPHIIAPSRPPRRRAGYLMFGGGMLRWEMPPINSIWKSCQTPHCRGRQINTILRLSEPKVGHTLRHACNQPGRLWNALPSPPTCLMLPSTHLHTHHTLNPPKFHPF